MMGPMKAATLLLVLAFGGLQGISVTDCPCGSLCETKNSCPDEKRHESPDDCCSRTRAKDHATTTNCFHLEPQSDLVGVSVDQDAVPVLILHPVVPPILVPPAGADKDLDGAGLSPPARGCPQFLRHRTLRI